MCWQYLRQLFCVSIVCSKRTENAPSLWRIFLDRFLKLTLQQVWSSIIGICTLWLNYQLMLQKRNGHYIYHFQLTRWQCASKKTNKNISPTRWEVMVSKTMISVNKDTHNKFKWKILLHPRSNFSGGSIHWIVVFLVSLIGYNMIITNFQRTTFINLIISTLNHTILRIMCYVMMLK